MKSKNSSKIALKMLKKEVDKITTGVFKIEQASDDGGPLFEVRTDKRKSKRMRQKLPLVYMGSRIVVTQVARETLIHSASR